MHCFTPIATISNRSTIQFKLHSRFNYIDDKIIHFMQIFLKGVSFHFRCVYAHTRALAPFFQLSSSGGFIFFLVIILYFAYAHSKQMQNKHKGQPILYLNLNTHITYTSTAKKNMHKKISNKLVFVATCNYTSPFHRQFTRELSCMQVILWYI